MLQASPTPTSTSAFIIRSSIVEYNQFKRLTSTLTDDDTLSYFIMRALSASPIDNHLMLSVFIHRELPNILHECLQVCLDYQCASIVTFAAFQGSRHQLAGMMCRVAPSRTGSTCLTAMTSSKTWSTSSSKGGSLYVTYMPLRIFYWVDVSLPSVVLRTFGEETMQ